MATYLSLEDAAKQLGIPTEKLIDLRSQGQVRGFRDGASWKFPDTEIERLKDELPNLSGLGSGILATDGGGSKPGSVIGGDSDLSIGDPILDEEGSGGSSLDLGVEPSAGGDSDVNLVAGDSGIGSDVLVVPDSSVGSDLPVDLDQVSVSGSALSHDSGELDRGAASDDSDEFNLGSALDLGGEDDVSLGQESSTPSPASGLELDSGDSSDALADGSDNDLDLGLVSGDAAASSLELMDDLDLQDSASSIGGLSQQSGDVLSELDLLAGESAGSGLLSGDSENLLGSSLLGAEEGGSSGVDDALADDDDLIIADDDDGDLVVSSMGSDISIAGDSGINLMSPSDSGLSLESEPLDLAGSSISALDLGAELSDASGSGGSSEYGSGLIPDDASGSAVDFQSDDEFQLSPSGIQLEASDDSASQVIDIEESESVEVEADFAEATFEGDGAFEGEVAFDEAPVMAGGFDDGMGEAQAIVEGDPMVEAEEDGAIQVAGGTAAAASGVPMAYEVPFTLFQTIGLLLILMVLSLGGMLMTDLVRNMWSYAEPSAPVSSLTDMLIDVAGWGR